MITLTLNEHIVEDFECIQELKRLGIPDNLIQEYYDREQKRRQADRGQENGKEQTKPASC